MTNVFDSMCKIEEPFQECIKDIIEFHVCIMDAKHKVEGQFHNSLRIPNGRATLSFSKSPISIARYEIQ